MTQAMIREVVEKLALEAKGVFGTDLKSVVLYGSCARGDYTSESDIDVMILLDIPVEELDEARKKISDISSRTMMWYLHRFFRVIKFSRNIFLFPHFIRTCREKVS